MQISCSGFDLGPFKLTCFSLIVVAAVFIGGAVTAWTARRKGEDPVTVFDLSGWMLFLGIVFGRLFYVLNPPPSVSALYSREWYLAHPLDMQIGPLAVWSGGLGMAGVLVGAMLGALLAIWRRRIDGWLWADICVPGLLLFLIIAPWSNLMMGQMIGPPTHLPWGVAVAYPPLSFNAGTLFHPTPAYLSIWALLILLGVGGVIRIGKMQFCKGDVFLAVSLLYGVGLFLADCLRVDVNRVLGLSGMQMLASGIVVWAASMIVWRYRRRAL